MKELNFNKVFNGDEVKDYNLFIEKLKSLKNSGYTTRELLILISGYYQENVTYNYDQLQIVKLNRCEKDESGYQCYKAGENISDRIAKLNNIAKRGELSLREIIKSEEFQSEEAKPLSKEEAIKLLDMAFINVEGRPLTKRNKERIFAHYGEIKHLPYQEERKSGMFTVREVKEHDEVRGIVTENYPAIYNNQMLIDGVCADYTEFQAKICKDLGIKHRKVRGVGTTGHAWSLIYLEDEDKWVHFDMTMVKFYQDRWIREHEPYIIQDWVAASTEDIFKMQPTRRILTIGNKKCNFSQDNYIVNIGEFVQEEEIEH